MTRPTKRPTVERPRLVGVRVAADHIDVSTATIRRWIASGRLPAYRLGNRVIKIDLADVDRLARRIPTAGDTSS